MHLWYGNTIFCYLALSHSCLDRIGTLSLTSSTVIESDIFCALSAQKMSRIRTSGLAFSPTLEKKDGAVLDCTVISGPSDSLMMMHLLPVINVKRKFEADSRVGGFRLSLSQHLGASRTVLYHWQWPKTVCPPEALAGHTELSLPG